MLMRIFKVKRVEASGPWRIHDEGHHDVTTFNFSHIFYSADYY
jgi:hypothetical protein